MGDIAFARLAIVECVLPTPIGACALVDEGRGVARNTWSAVLARRLYTVCLKSIRGLLPMLTTRPRSTHAFARCNELHHLEPARYGVQVTEGAGAYRYLNFSALIDICDQQSDCRADGMNVLGGTYERL